MIDSLHLIYIRHAKRGSGGRLFQGEGTVVKFRRATENTKQHKYFDNAKDKYHSCLIMLDIRKAFDTVNHKTFIIKVISSRNTWYSIQLIPSYLNNRSQFVNINNKLSKNLIIKHGVPQGSNLGSLLFLIYINDLPNASSCHTTLFADDTCLLIQAKDVSTLQKRSNSELSKVHQWMNCNKLTLNPNKTQVLLIPSSRHQVISTIKLYLNNELIKPIETAKYLGITLDSQLKFDIYTVFRNY